MSPKKLRMLRELPAMLLDALKYGATAYANGASGTPLVDAHFTPSNKGRYNFPALSPKYEKRKDKTFGPKPILVRSGDLRRSVNNKSHLVRIVGSNCVITFKDLVDYAIYHHEGGPNLPKRSPVEPCAEDIERVIQFARAEIKKRTGLAMDIVIK